MQISLSMKQNSAAPCLPTTPDHLRQSQIWNPVLVIHLVLEFEILQNAHNLPRNVMILALNTPFCMLIFCFNSKGPIIQDYNFPC